MSVGDIIVKALGDKLSEGEKRELLKELDFIQNTNRNVARQVNTAGQMNRLRAGPVVINRKGLELRNAGIVTMELNKDGDLFAGSDLSDPSTTSLAVFSNDQLYNDEDVEEGDVLLGDNSSSKANLYWDVSTGQLKFRGGTTTQAYVDTDGAITAGAGNVVINSIGIQLANNIDTLLSFADSGGNQNNIEIYSNDSDSLVLENEIAGAMIRQIIKLDGGGTPSLYWYEYPGVADRVRLYFETGAQGGAFGVGNSVELAAHGGSGGPAESVLNGNGDDINLRNEGDAQTHLWFCDAGTDRVGINQSSPDNQLHVAGVAKFETSSSSIGGSNIFDNPDTTDGNGLKLNFTTTTTGAGAAADTALAQIRPVFDTHDHASRAGSIQLLTSQGGNPAARVKIGAGVQVGSPTGGDKGAGTANFDNDIYKDNAAYNSPDFVLEHFYRGKIVEFAENEGASEYEGLPDLMDVDTYMEENLHLPQVHREPMGAFERSDKCLIITEQQFLYLIDHEKRLRALEDKCL